MGTRVTEGGMWDRQQRAASSSAPACWPFDGVTEPDWHILQRDRWDALERAGWRFSRPADTDGGIGLSMERMTVRVTIICGRHDTLLNTHTRLLTLCEGIHTANDQVDFQKGARSAE
jgi:hypothetical protein